MSIEERRNEVIEFRWGDDKLGLREITAEPGEVHAMMPSFKTMADVEEFIEALRRAAKAANLPDGPGEAKTA